MTAIDWPLLELSMLLGHDDPTPKVHCADARFNQWGRQVAECVLHEGHEYEHIDTHEGKRWAR